MATYEVTGPDGKVHLFDGPEDATAAEIEDAARQIFAANPSGRAEPKIGTKAAVRRGTGSGGLSKPPPTPQPTQDDRRLYSPTAGMDTWGRNGTVATGLGKSLADAYRGAKGLIVDNGAEVTESRQRDAPLMNTGGGQAGNLAGTVGTFLVPGGAVKAAGIAAGALRAPAAAEALSVAGSALLAPRGVRAGAAVGGATGALQPAADNGERFDNMTTGALAGGVIPAVGLGYRAGMSALEPFYEAGQQRIIGRTLNNAAGRDAPNVVQRLEAAQVPFTGPQTGVPRQTMGELVPGSVPTLSQVADNPGITALEQASQAVNPAAKLAVRDAHTAQQAARRGVLDDVAGTDGQRAFYANERDATADQLYQQAFGAQMDPAAVHRMQPVFERLSANPYIQQVAGEARTLARGAGVDLDLGSVQGMHYLKLALDDAIHVAGQPGTAAGRTRLAQMQQAQRELVGAIEGVSPDYAAARQTFMEMSRPINQMDTGQRLRDVGVDTLTGNIKPRPLANAIESDRTAQTATGYRGATMEGTLDNHTANRLQMLLEDVRRAERTSREGRGIGSNSVQNLAYSNMMEQSGMPTWLRGFAPVSITGGIMGRVADAGYGRANNQLQQLLADALQDPAAVAALMRSTGPYANNGLAEILRLGAQPVATALPSAVNAYKQ